MRLFVSLNLDEGTRNALAGVQAELKEEAEKKFPGSIKWDKPGNFHMTVFFIGDADTDKAERIISALNEVKGKFEGKELKFISEGISGFPNLKKPRVVFASAENKDKEIFTLSGMIRNQMGELGYKDEKAFHPHITLGRIRKDRRINLEGITAGNFKVEFTCTEFYLMESKMSWEGSEYRIIKEFGLG